MARNGNAKTKHVALNMLKAGVAITGAALLFACGDDDSSFVASENGGSAAEADIVVATFDYLPNCTDNREGKTAYIKDEKATYVCVDGDWITGSISESVDDLLNCTSKHEGETVFVKEDKEIYVCTDGDWVVAGETGNEGDGDDDDGDDAEKKSSSSTAKSADSKGKSSSSEGVGDASSSSVIASSSSEEQAGSCSSDELSSSSRGLFEMSKDEFLNPKITYGTMTDTRDNKTYKTVKIGTQVWMAENLNYSVNPGTQSWCGGGENNTKIEGDCSVYGRLYTWAAAVDSVAIYKNYGEECGYGKSCARFSATALATVPVRGVCPSGWHLPSNGEWSALYMNVSGTGAAGWDLKANTSLWSRKMGTDEYGFSVLPAGRRFYGGRFWDSGRGAYFWSSTEYENSSYDAWYQSFYYIYVDAYQGRNRKDDAFSVRCLQN